MLGIIDFYMLVFILINMNRVKLTENKVNIYIRVGFNEKLKLEISPYLDLSL